MRIAIHLTIGLLGSNGKATLDSHLAQKKYLLVRMASIKFMHFDTARLCP